jgi:hypothetical protein
MFFFDEYQLEQRQLDREQLTGLIEELTRIDGELYRMGVNVYGTPESWLLTYGGRVDPFGPAADQGEIVAIIGKHNRQDGGQEDRQENGQ